MVKGQCGKWGRTKVEPPSQDPLEPLGRTKCDHLRAAGQGKPTARHPGS